MKIKVDNRRKQRKRVETLVNRTGTRAERVAYSSIISNIIGLTRKVQGLNQKVKNRDRVIFRQQQDLSDVRYDAEKLANHIAGSKADLPDEWYEWAAEIEQSLRKLSGGEK